MLWWLWMLLGLALVVLEVLTPGGFFALFFGIGALLVGALDGLGMGGPDWLQWLLFSVFSIVSLLLFRGPLLARLKSWGRKPNGVDTLVGEVATLLDDLPADAIGKVELRGTPWSAGRPLRGPSGATRRSTGPRRPAAASRVAAVKIKPATWSV